MKSTGCFFTQYAQDSPNTICECKHNIEGGTTIMQMHVIPDFPVGRHRLHQSVACQMEEVRFPVGCNANADGVLQNFCAKWVRTKESYCIMYVYVHANIVQYRGYVMCAPDCFKSPVLPHCNQLRRRQLPCLRGQICGEQNGVLNEKSISVPARQTAEKSAGFVCYTCAL